jgi:hypothetical protein
LPLPVPPKNSKSINHELNPAINCQSSIDKKFNFLGDSNHIWGGVTSAVERQLALQNDQLLLIATFVVVTHTITPILLLLLLLLLLLTVYK